MGRNVVEYGDCVRAAEEECASTLIGSFTLSLQNGGRRSVAEAGRLLDAFTEAEEFTVAENMGFTLA